MYSVGYDFLGNHDQPPTRLGLLLVLPPRPVYLAVALPVGYLHVHQRHVRRQRPQGDILFPGKRTLHPLHISRARSRLQPFQHLGTQQRFDGDERKAQRAGQIPKAHRQAGVVFTQKRLRFPRAVHARNRSKPVQRPPAHDQVLHQPGSHQQVRIQAHHSLGDGQIALLLADQFVHHGNHIAGNRKSAQGNVGSGRNGLNHLCRRFDLAQRTRSAHSILNAADLGLIRSLRQRRAYNDPAKSVKLKINAILIYRQIRYLY